MIMAIMIMATMVITAGRKSSRAGRRVQGVAAGVDRVSSVCIVVARLAQAAHSVVHGDRTAHRVPARDTVSSGAAT